MRTLFITDQYLPHGGGSRVYYHNLLKNWHRHFPSDEVTILTKKVPGWEAFDKAESSEALRIVRRFRPLPDLKYQQLPKAIFPLVEAFYLARSRKIDLVHTGDIYPPGVVGLALKRVLGIPYLAYCHGDELMQIDQSRYKPVVRDKVYMGADIVVAACEFARQNLIRIGVPEGRIRKITPGVDYERFTPGPPREDLVRKYGLQGKKVLLQVARLVPRKGHDVALQAVAKILPEIPDLQFLIVGNGSDEQRLRNLVSELGIQNAVTFVGFVTNDQVPDYYNLCDVFVMPNRYGADGDIEGFGMIFMEASSAAKPVIGGKSGGTDDAVAHGVTGFLVNPTDVDELAATLKLLLSNPELCRRFGNAGYQRARTEFDWNSRAKTLAQISHEIVEKGRAAENAQAPSHNPQTKIEC